MSEAAYALGKKECMPARQFAGLHSEARRAREQPRGGARQSGQRWLAARTCEKALEKGDR